MPRTLPPWAPLLAVAAAASAAMALATPTFGTSFNVFVILQGAATFALLGFAVMVVLSVRDVTLAVGGIGSSCAVLFGWLVERAAAPLALAVVATLAVGAAIGLVNGMIVTRSGLNGFIVTLATGAALSGLALGFTKASAFTRIPESWTTFGQARWGFLPVISLVTLGVAGLLHVLYAATPAGRAMLAVGGNPEAARLAGISTARHLVRAHVLSGVLAAVAALVFVGRLGSASPDLGSTWILVSFAVAIIGGAALDGGRVSVPGALVAALVLSTISDALILLKVSQYGVLFAQGLLILVAVALGRLGVRGRLGRLGVGRRPLLEQGAR